MTDAFRCNGCGEYYDQPFRFVTLDMDVDSIRLFEFTLDDVPTDAWELVGNDDAGDYCPECGLDALRTLVDCFQEADS